MKTSNAVLVGIGSTLAVVVVVGVIVARLVLNNFVTVPIDGAGSSPGTVSGTTATRTYDLSGFTAVSASGAWDVTISRGSAYSIKVSASDREANNLDVRIRGDKLVLGFKPGTTTTNQRIAATISMPKLDSVQLTGANHASLSGFTGDLLDVRCSGAASITGSGGSYRELKVAASGASNVELRRLPVDSAEIDVTGAGQVALQMNGGSLKGRLSGASRVTYWGTVSEQKIQTSGIGSVVHR